MNFAASVARVAIEAMPSILFTFGIGTAYMRLLQYFKLDGFDLHTLVRRVVHEGNKSAKRHNNFSTFCREIEPRGRRCIHLAELVAAKLRASLGLPEVGREQSLFGHLGIDLSAL